MFSLCHMGTLMPSIGSPVPAPTVLAVVHCPLQLQVEASLDGDHSGGLQVNSASEAIPVPNALSQKEKHVEKMVSSPVEATLLSITDDGRLWRWVINEDDAEIESASSNGMKPRSHRNSGESNSSGELANSSSNGFNSDLLFKVCLIAVKLRRNQSHVHSYLCYSEKSSFCFSVLDFKSLWCLVCQQLDLTGQLHLLSSAVTTLAVPMPSLLAISPGKRQLYLWERFVLLYNIFVARLRQS